MLSVYQYVPENIRKLKCIFKNERTDILKE